MVMVMVMVMPKTHMPDTALDATVVLYTLLSTFALESHAICFRLCCCHVMLCEPSYQYDMQAQLLCSV